MLLECDFRPVQTLKGIRVLFRNWKTLEEILGNKLKVNPS
jgi:hypothetical protein